MKEIIDTADTLPTEELDKLILDLANLRFTKEPAVSFNPPKVDDNTYGINIQDNPYIEATLLKDGRTRMWIRNGGLGWLILNLTNEQTITLRDYLNASTDSDSVSVLFSEGHFDKSSPH